MYSTWWIIKTIIYPAVAVACAYLRLDQELIWILSVLVIIDFITGIFRSYRVWEKITSARMWSWAVSKFLLIFIPFILALGFKSIWWDTHKVLSVMLSVLVVAETYSAISNIYQSIKWEAMEEFDVISLVLSKILLKLKNIIEKLLK